VNNATFKYQELISGTDIRGIAIGEGAVLTSEAAFRFGAAFAAYLAARFSLPLDRVSVAVGRDSRLSGLALMKAACEGIVSGGAKAYDCGMCTTPSMYMAILEPGFTPTGSIMITASHHPWNINGMKYFTESGGLGHDDIERLAASAENGQKTSGQNPGSIADYPYIPLYQWRLKTLIKKGLGSSSDHPLNGLHVVVDAGNGAGGFYAQMLQSLGARTEGSQFLDPDGRFPNHPPNPENEQAMDSVSQAVTRAGADLGVIFDADCDRAAIVDSTGKEINRNRLIALIGAILLQRHPGATIVTDSVTSSGLAAFIRERGGTQYRYKRGYRNVIDEAIRLNSAGIDCPLAIETSGHAALRENRFLDDGMYLVTYLIIRAMLLKREGKSLSSLIEGLREPLESAEYRLKILVPDFRKAGESAVQSIFKQTSGQSGCRIAPDNREGVRISFDLDGGRDHGWILLRLSVHDPVMPLNVESDVKGGSVKMLRVLYEMLKTRSDLDLSALKTALET
jgi:phosphomannomutase